MLTSEAGNEFSNNLFSDLAPILALFGERVTQQYLSHTSSIWECVIFACAPIGIITAVVAAIRVGGTGSLKAIIGRAREPKADVELELMSSTSLDVCELWSDGGVARLGGTLPNIVEILVRDRSSKRRCLELFTLESAIREGLYTCNSIEKQEPHLQQMEALSGNRADLEEIRTEVRMTPNLSFNLAGGTPSKGELIPIAVIGIVLQLGVIILAGSSAYSPGLRQKIADMDIPAYAFPMFAVGTLFICIGMFICAYVVDHSTEDLVWEPDTRFQLHKLLWLQKGSFVGDQEFRSYIISARADHIRRGEVLTSRRVQRRPDSTSGNLRALVSPPMLTVVGTCFSISGFISQFIGLRALHWSVSISQLGAALIMTLLRVFLRRNISASPEVTLLTPDLELDYLAKDLSNCESFSVCTDLRGIHWHLSENREHEQEARSGSDNVHVPEDVVKLRMDLASITGWQPGWEERLDRMCTCMENILAHIYNTKEVFQTKRNVGSFDFHVPINTVFKTPRAEAAARLTICRIQVKALGRHGDVNGTWKIDRSMLSALFSLWISSSDKSPNTAPQNTIWMLGCSQQQSTHRFYDWWLPKDVDAFKFDGSNDISEVVSAPTETGEIQYWGAATQVSSSPVGSSTTGYPTTSQMEIDSSAFGESDRDAGTARSTMSSVKFYPHKLERTKKGSKYLAVHGSSELHIVDVFAQFLTSLFLTEVFEGQAVAGSLMGDMIVQKLDIRNWARTAITISHPAILGLVEVLEMGGIPKNDSQRLVACALDSAGLLPDILSHGLHSKMISLAYEVQQQAILTGDNEAVEFSENALTRLLGLLLSLCEEKAQSLIREQRWREAGSSFLSIRAELEERNEHLLVRLVDEAIVKFIDKRLRAPNNGPNGSRLVYHEEVTPIDRESWAPSASMLEWAARFGYPRCILWAYEDQMELKDSSQLRAMEIAIQHRRWSVVQLLFFFGAQIAGVEKDSPVGQLKGLEMLGVEILTHNGASELIDRTIHISGYGDAHSSLDFEEAVKLASDKGIDPERIARLIARGLENLTSDEVIQTSLKLLSDFLHKAIENCYIDPVAVLLRDSRIQAQFRYFMKQRDSHGNTPLHKAAAFGNDMILTMLLATGHCFVNARTKKHETALHRAAKKGNLVAAKLLLSHDPSLLAKEKYKEAMEGLAVCSRLPALRNSQPPDIFAVMSKQKPALMKMDVDSRDCLGRTPFMLAAAAGSYHLVEFLYSENANLFLRDGKGRNALMCCFRGLEKTLKRNTDENCDVYEKYREVLSFLVSLAQEKLETARDVEGRISLHYSTMVPYDLDFIVEALVEHGVAVETKDGKGRTPLHYAYINRRMRAVEILEEAGADRTVQDKDGKSPWDVHLETTAQQDKSHEGADVKGKGKEIERSEPENGSNVKQDSDDEEIEDSSDTELLHGA